MMQPDDWHQQEARRINKRSMRRAIVASAILVFLLWFFLIPHN